MTVTVEKHWDGNVCESQVGRRIYVSHGRWQWVLLKDGDVVETFDRLRDAQEYSSRVLGTTATVVRTDN